MATIKKENKNENLTIFSVCGVLTAEEVIKVLDAFFSNKITKNILWDFTKADVSKVTQKDMEQIINLGKAKAHLRKNGKTALIVKNKLSYGMSRKYEILSEIEQHQIQHRVFTDLDEAIAWLESTES